MPKARTRKDSAFQASPVKSVFLYGDPNKGKLARLSAIQELYTSMVNGYIRSLSMNTDILLQLVKNDRKDPQMRELEKSMRRPGTNSAFCQNAFDAAVTHLSNRLDAIRTDMLDCGCGIFAQSRVLFAMSAAGRTREEMVSAMGRIRGQFYRDCAAELSGMSDAAFADAQREFAVHYQSVSLEHRIPHLSNSSVPLDTRLAKVEPSYGTAMPFVVSITDPEKKRSRIIVPVGTSTHSLHKIRCSHMAGTVHMQVRGAKLRVGWSYSSRREEPEAVETVGVDTGITDALHTSDGRAIGSLAGVTGFYRDTVEPAFAQLSALRNKKRAISHYLRHHDLPPDVGRSLIRKMDRLDRMVQTMDAPYRKKRRYYGMLDHEISSAVKAYTGSIRPGTLTVIEKLDIKEFHDSHGSNGRLSTFARGRLQGRLIEALNWKGAGFLEVPPEYTSQLCPVCHNLDRSSRDGKVFRCTCCGYTDDADHNAAANIRSRAADTEVLDICRSYRYSRAVRMESLRGLYAKRHEGYLNDTASA